MGPYPSDWLWTEVWSELIWRGWIAVDRPDVAGSVAMGGGGSGGGGCTSSKWFLRPGFSDPRAPGAMAREVGAKRGR